MENKQLIPFSKELWETGEYEAATGSCNNVDVIEVTEKGNVYYGENEIGGPIKALNYKNSDSIILRKKTKKVWIGVNKEHAFETKEEAESWGRAFFSSFIKAIEIEI